MQSGIMSIVNGFLDNDMSNPKSPIEMLLDGATWTPLIQNAPPDGPLYATHSGVLDLGGAF